MGIKLDRIEKEFILQSLIEKQINLKIHGNKTEFEGRLLSFDENTMDIEILDEFDLKKMQL